jgi:hypothetical protein
MKETRVAAFSVAVSLYCVYRDHAVCVCITCVSWCFFFFFEYAVIVCFLRVRVCVRLSCSALLPLLNVCVCMRCVCVCVCVCTPVCVWWVHTTCLCVTCSIASSLLAAESLVGTLQDGWWICHRVSHSK